MIDSLITILGNVLSPVMTICCRLSGNYGIAVFLFALIARIILLPISVMLHFNSIKMVKMQPDINFAKVTYHGDKDRIGEEQVKLYKKYNYHPMLGLVPLAIQLLLLMGVIDVIYRQLSDDMMFVGMNLSYVPKDAGGFYYLIPLVVAFSAWLLCFVQDRANVLQSEQSIFNKMFTMLLSVGLSLYLGFFVPSAVGIYWMYGNLLAVVQLFCLNGIFSPKKYIDYEKLEGSRKALKKMRDKDAEVNKKFFEKDPYRVKEKADYKRFYSTHNKQIVFYSEKSGYYKYYQNIIEYILENSNELIHYVTSDPQDIIFSIKNERLSTYYISNKRIISFMLKMDSNVVVMTTPDLDKYFIKKSLVRKDIEYIYFPHGVSSPNSSLRTGALDNFDTCFVEGPRAEAEIRAIEKLHGTKEKNLIKWGSCVLENMIKAYDDSEKEEREEKVVLIAPSWQDDNIVDTCAIELIESLLETGYKVVLRPHPQFMRYGKERMDEIDAYFKEEERFTLQRDFSSNETVYSADLLVTDWSGIAFEYAFATLKPVLFINTPMKVMNPEWEQIEVVPLDVAIRSEVGMNIDPDKVSQAGEVAKKLIESTSDYKEKNRNLRNREIYNLSGCGEIGGKYVLEANKRVDDNKEEYLRYL